MNVSMWMTRNALTIGREIPVVEAAAMMARKKVRRLLVAEKREAGLHLLGIISTKDVIRAFPPDVNPFAVEAPVKGQTPKTAGEIMRTNLLTTTPETPIEEAAAIMRSEKIGALPVLMKDHLVGIITESDVFRAFVSLFTSDESGARITFDATKGEDVFGLLVKLSKRDKVRVLTLIWTHQEI